MDKEKALTIVLGLLAGIAIAAGGYIYFLKFWSTNTSQPNTPSLTPKNQTLITKTAGLAWISPSENLITKEKILEVSGTGPTGTRILLLSSIEEKTLTIGEDKKFFLKINLEEGENKITLIHWGADQNPVVITRTTTLEI